MKRLLCLLGVTFVFLPSAAVRGAEERITLTTYYPAPFGAHRGTLNPDGSPRDK